MTIEERIQHQRDILRECDEEMVTLTDHWQVNPSEVFHLLGREAAARIELSDLEDAQEDEP